MLQRPEGSELSAGTAAVRVPTVPFPRTLERQIADIMAQTAPRRDSTGTDRRAVSVLFIRIDGYVALCEDLDPTQIGPILMLSLQAAADSIGMFAGSLLGSLGDTVVATWNAVYPQPDHALLAVNAAMDMVERTADINMRLGPDIPDIQYAVGVNTGDALVQRTGARRNDHEVVGDSVNIAHLLSIVASDGCILMGEGTRISTDGEILAQDEGVIALPGRKAPIRAYRVIGRSGDEIEV